MDKKGRTSIDVARFCIEENNEQIEWYRKHIIDQQKTIDRNKASIAECQKEISNLTRRISQLKSTIIDLNTSIRDIEHDIIEADAVKFEYLVTNQALTAFIASGGGLDMLC